MKLNMEYDEYKTSSPERRKQLWLSWTYLERQWVYVAALPRFRDEQRRWRAELERKQEDETESERTEPQPQRGPHLAFWKEKRRREYQKDLSACGDVHKNPGPSGPTRSPESTSQDASDWTRDLTQDGDVHPNPGPPKADSRGRGQSGRSEGGRGRGHGGGGKVALRTEEENRRKERPKPPAQQALAPRASPKNRASVTTTSPRCSEGNSCPHCGQFVNSCGGGFQQ